MPVEAVEAPFAAVKRGARCDLQADGSLTCRYVVGQDLEFELRRVGERGVALHVIRSEKEGDYHVDAEMMSRCAFVRFGARGLAAGGRDFVYAFASGRNGLVYGTLRECRLGR